jgi:hypothetical protein
MRIEWLSSTVILLLVVTFTVSDFTESYFESPESNQAVDGSVNHQILSEYTDASDSLLYSTLIGGIRDERMRSVCVVEGDSIYITGSTRSPDFPRNRAEYGFPNGSYYPSFDDCFVMKFNSSGLVFTAFVGGSESDSPYDIVLDDEGNIYVAGATYSSDFPATTSFGNWSGGIDCFVFKLSPAGDELLYSTVIRGNNEERAKAIDVDDAGCAYITGYTFSRNFPMVHAFDKTYGGDRLDDCFITKLSPDGDEILYSTYFGGYGSDQGNSILVDEQGYIYIGGATSFDIPLVNAFDDTFGGYQDGFVGKLTPSGDEVIFSTYLGGSSRDGVQGIDVDGDGNVYATGYTQSTNFPLLNAYDAEYGGYQEESDQCFVLGLNSTGNGLLYSTYLGGSSQDIGQSIKVDMGGYAYVAGETRSSDFPTLLAYDNTSNGGVDSFVSRFSPQGDKLMYSTFVGGSRNDFTRALTIDEYGTAYVGGFTASSDFPLVDPFDSTLNGSEDCFLYKLADFSDSDNDTLSEYEESLYGTNRFSADTDQDFLSDAEEIFLYGTSPLLADSDNDTFNDAWEIENGFNPLDPLEPLQMIQTQQLILASAITTVVLTLVTVGLLLWHRARKSRMKQEEMESEEREAVQGLLPPS